MSLSTSEVVLFSSQMFYLVTPVGIPPGQGSAALDLLLLTDFLSVLVRTALCLGL